MIKNLIRKLFNFLHLDVTKNLQYDRLTKKIMKKYIDTNANCIDVGCHKGEILDIMLAQSPNGKHYAFEPIPFFYNQLKIKYKTTYKEVCIYPYALSSTEGSTSFNYVKNDPAYSGLQQRSYDIAKPQIEIINVDKKKLDDLIPNDQVIDFIKIDVEGGEFDVLKGGMETIKRCKPLIIFECGKGASDYYGTQPKDIFTFITDNLGMKVFTLPDFANNKESLSQKKFANYFETASEYYYVAKY